MNIKKLFRKGIALAMLVACCVKAPVQAANVKEIPATEIDSVYNLAVDSNGLTGWAQGPQIYSEAGIVMDMDSGAILYAKNIDDQHYPASITKVATALVALQHYSMDEIVTFTWDDVGFLEYGDAHIGIKPDEQVRMEDCMYGMLLASANEVSHGIGAHMEGGFDQFIAVMNQTVQELGCKNTHFTNTYGLHDEEHYTSVRDMAIISSAVFQYEEFRKITGTLQYTIPETNITNEKRTFQQNHKMLREWDDRYYEYCVGGKTGFTDQALTTLVTFATKGDMNLVAVVMRTHGGGNNAYKDTRKMLDYGFDNFTKVSVTQEMLANEHIESIDSDAYVVLPSGISFEQLQIQYTEPTELGVKAGEIAFTYGGQPVGKAGMMITEEYHNELHGIEEVKEEPKKETKNPLPTILKVFGGIFLVSVVAVVALIIFVVYRRKQIQKRRRQRRTKRRKELERMKDEGTE